MRTRQQAGFHMNGPTFDHEADRAALIPSVVGKRCIGFAQGLMKGARFAFEPVGHPLAAPLLGARKPNLGRDVEDEREVRLEVANAHAFKRADDVLLRAVQGITDLIITPGIINLDFADVTTVMRGKG